MIMQKFPSCPADLPASYIRGSWNGWCDGFLVEGTNHAVSIDWERYCVVYDLRNNEGKLVVVLKHHYNPKCLDFPLIKEKHLASGTLIEERFDKEGNLISSKIDPVSYRAGRCAAVYTHNAQQVFEKLNILEVAEKTINKLRSLGLTFTPLEASTFQKAREAYAHIDAVFTTLRALIRECEVDVVYDNSIKED